MPNYDGLTPEQKKRQQVAHEKLSHDFRRVTRGAVRASEAPSGKVLQIQLTVDGTLRLVGTPSERLRIQIAQRQADRLAAIEVVKVDRAHRKGALVKEFAKSARRNKEMDRER